ncbi:MAG: hypothetical protein LBF83_10980 [Spirochaetaceae bacterium]|jgi:phosphoglycerate dehydrogenase-like enzyme|nr:hypothetical protein [Spirochaetaceae bacterium]
MQKRCFLSIALHPEAAKKLNDNFHVTQSVKELQFADAAVVYSPDPNWDFLKCNRLKIIACHAADNNIANTCRKNNILVFESTRIWRTVAEHTVALLLSAIRNIPAADNDVKNDNWKNHEDLKIKHSGLDIYGKTVGIWGLGKIGKYIAWMLNGFDVEVVYNDVIHLNAMEEQQLGVTFRSGDDFFATIDYLIMMLPLNENTRGIMNDSIFNKIKKQIVLVNSARAGLIEESSLQKAIENNVVISCAMDVLWKEASPLPDWIKKNKRIITVPHLGGSTKECDMELVNEVISIFK